MCRIPRKQRHRLPNVSKYACATVLSEFNSGSRSIDDMSFFDKLDRKLPQKLCDVTNKVKKKYTIDMALATRFLKI